MENLHTKLQAVATTFEQQHCLAELKRGIEKKYSIEDQLRLQSAVIDATLFGLNIVQKYRPLNNTVEDKQETTS